LKKKQTNRNQKFNKSYKKTQGKTSTTRLEDKADKLKHSESNKEKKKL
jgi:hypothetical protein